MDWSLALGLTKEAPVEPYLQVLQFRELQERKKIAAAQAEKERQDKLLALLKYDNADIHQSLFNDYTKKANEVLLPAMQKFQQGTLTEPEAFQTQAKLIDLKNQYQSETKSLREFQANKDIKTAHGVYLKGALNQGIPIEEIYRKSSFEDNPYSRLFNKEGKLDWTNAYSGTINPFEDLEKANKNKILIGRSNQGDYLMETYGIPQTRDMLVKSGYYGKGEGIPVWQEMLQEASNRPTFVNDVAATYPKEFYQSEQNAQRAYIETKLKERGIAMDDPNLKNYVTEIVTEMKNDPMVLRSLKQKAAVDVGMTYQTGVYSESKLKPKTTFNFGGSSKASEGKKVTEYFNTLNSAGIHKKIANASASNNYSPEQILDMYAFPFTQTPNTFGNIEANNRVVSAPLPLPPDATKGINYQTIRKSDYVKVTIDGQDKYVPLTDFINTIAKKEGVKPEDLYSYVNQLPMRLQTSDMIFKDNNGSGKPLTGNQAINNKKSIPNYRPVIRYVYGVTPQGGEEGGEEEKGGFNISVGGKNTVKDKIYNIFYKYNLGIIKDVKQGETSAYDKLYSTEDSYTLDKTKPLLSGQKFTAPTLTGFE